MIALGYVSMVSLVLISLPMYAHSAAFAVPSLTSYQIQRQASHSERRHEFIKDRFNLQYRDKGHAMLPPDMDILLTNQQVGPIQYNDAIATFLPSSFLCSLSSAVEQSQSPLSKLVQMMHYFYDCLLAVTGIGILNGIFLNRQKEKLRLIEGEEKYFNLKSAMPSPGDYTVFSISSSTSTTNSRNDFPTNQIMTGQEKRSLLPPESSASSVDTTSSSNGVPSDKNQHPHNPIHLATANGGALAALFKKELERRSNASSSTSMDYLTPLQKSVPVSSMKEYNSTTNGVSMQSYSPGSNRTNAWNSDDDDELYTGVKNHNDGYAAADTTSFVSKATNEEELDYTGGVAVAETDIMVPPPHSILNPDFSIQETIEEFSKERRLYGNVPLGEDSINESNPQHDQNDIYEELEMVHSELPLDGRVNDEKPFSMMDSTTESNDGAESSVNHNEDAANVKSTASSATNIQDENQLQINPNASKHGHYDETQDCDTIHDISMSTDNGLTSELESFQDPSNVKEDDVLIPFFDNDYNNFTDKSENTVFSEGTNNLDTEEPVEAFSDDADWDMSGKDNDTEFFTNDSISSEDENDTEFYRNESVFNQDTATASNEVLYEEGIDFDHVILDENNDDDTMTFDNLEETADTTPAKNPPQNCDDDDDDDHPTSTITTTATITDEDAAWSEITTPAHVSEDDFKMAQGLAKAAFHAELKKQSVTKERRIDSNTNYYKTQIENDMRMVREYAKKKNVLKSVAKAQGDQTSASELLKRLAEKERRRKFESIGLIDPRLYKNGSENQGGTRYERPIPRRNQEVWEDDSEDDVDPEDTRLDDTAIAEDKKQETQDDKDVKKKPDASLPIEMKVTEKKRVTMFSLAKKRPVIFAAATIVIAQRLASLWFGGGLLL